MAIGLLGRADEKPESVCREAELREAESRARRSDGCMGKVAIYRRVEFDRVVSTMELEGRASALP